MEYTAEPVSSVYVQSGDAPWIFDQIRDDA
jgi:hypothetical protein